ncbi:unnamed protein product [Wuchereria bancrofti]|uniref:Uncharacterized protein n=1 Tax=Wuchereria bancrofti TaxID=6293 RepID=A0A3P7EAL9_WUCBA|nr:unnamed protein product [Wuchereria bancrofti]
MTKDLQRNICSIIKKKNPDSTAKMRCRLRKQLFIKRNKICEISLAFGLAGLIFIIIDSEITAATGDSDFNKVKIG